MKYTKYRSNFSLRFGSVQKGGRNCEGKITVRHRGGGHKQAYRSIDWNRSYSKGLIVSFEYDPQRNASLAKLYHDTTSSKENSVNSKDYSYILAPSGVKLFQEVFTYGKYNQKLNRGMQRLQYGDSAPIQFFETGDFIHAVEAFPGQGSIFGRAAGSFCQVISFTQKTEDDIASQSSSTYAKIRLPSGSQRLINTSAYASLGVVASIFAQKLNLKKAGRSRWLGFRPSVRGVAINPVDHPHGGGQGKTSGGRPSVTFKSWPTKGKPTRSVKRKNIFILSSRKKV